MRIRKISWATYFQGVAIVLIIFLTWCYLQSPLSPVSDAVPSTSALKSFRRDHLEGESEPNEPKDAKEVSQKSDSFQESESRWVMPRVLSMKQELVAWINGVATFQEVEALNMLRKTLSDGRDSLTISRQLHNLRPDGWMFCVQEGEVCHCDGGITRYGDFDKDEWVERNEPKSPILCIHAQYGLTPEKDISPGKVKYCQCKTGGLKCPEGQPYHPERCPQGINKPCRAGCVARMQRSALSPVHSSKLCERMRPNELIWSCQKHLSLKPQKGHKHSEAEELLERATEKLCEDRLLAPEMEVWLECDFLSQFQRWTSSSSPWIEEAYVTYVGGPRDSTFEWQATNLIRSIDLFSTRPLVVVIFGNEFVPPLLWQNMRHVIVFRMRHISRGVSFNFNKIRSILAARVIVGIQLDTDQLIFKWMDEVFEGTKRECNERYPWPILPVHWMSRDDTPGNPYAHYAFKGWDGPQTMRWNHAHPTWSFWAVIFFGDLMHERMLAATGRRTSTVIHDLETVRNGSMGLMDLVRQGNKAKVSRHVEMSNAMWEDEDMINVNLWRHKVSKAWCKFDLEPNLFLLRKSLDRNLFFDPKWYPQGVPVLFLSIHNTKNFDPSDWLLHLLETCKDGVEELECPRKESEFMLPLCRVGDLEERKVRSKIEDYSSLACCCLEPRWSHPAFWRGQWFKSLQEIPQRHRDGGKDRPCLIP
ncbi:unnamed protein product [Durusdinium trenchii]|uniref:Protein xylosyltransferase n=1 Tax=Durusdinium trenchii TaxID=1381693 RepID=A0ABP0SKT6_9DINO